MKKILLAMVFALIASVSLVGCGDEPEPQPTPEEPEKVYYDVSWKDENGTLLKTDKVEEGNTPSYSYTVTDTAEWDYTFKGWANEPDGTVLQSIPTASANATYYAVVSKVKQEYTVIFNSNGGSTVQSQRIEYGSKATLPEAPTYDGYRFVGWCTDANGENPVDFDTPITKNVEYFATWNKSVDLKALLSALLSGYELDPFSYIPESMLPGYSQNLVDADDIIESYTGFVNVSDVTYGYGEQWHMVVENLEQTKLFFNILSVIDSISSASITAFNNYIDENPAETAHHSFASGVYSINIHIDEDTVSYVVDYTAELPVLGEQSVQIALEMDIESGEKKVRIQLGDANALAYSIKENSYEFAIKYLGVRRAFFTVSRDEDDNVSGKIYEHLTVMSADVASCAEFYITDEYVSVVGNKASGMIGFTGTLTELYDVENGKMLGYEVQETLSKIVYNTLWFNLNDIDGIDSVKYKEANGDDPAKVYINGSSQVWEAKKVGGIGTKMLSRRFDIEMRTQYVYSYDESNEEYVMHEIKVPMIFVQEENFETFADDVESTNDVSITLTVASEDVEKILEDYDGLIPDFIENKDAVTADAIIEYIGDKTEF